MKNYMEFIATLGDNHLKECKDKALFVGRNLEQTPHHI